LLQEYNIINKLKKIDTSLTNTINVFKNNKHYENLFNNKGTKLDVRNAN